MFGCCSTANEAYCNSVDPHLVYKCCALISVSEIQEEDLIPVVPARGSW